MEKRSVLKKVVDTFSGPAPLTLGCELPEAPGLKLPQERSLPQHESSFSGLSFKRTTALSNKDGETKIPLAYRERGYAKDVKP
jgi:hypothetical protein